MKSMRERFPSMDDLKKLVWKEARQNKGIAYTIQGRPLLVRQILSRDRATRASGERKAFSYTIQGSAAIIMKLLHLESADYIREMNSALAAVVHDEMLGYTYGVDPEATKLIATELTQGLTHHWSSATMLGNVPIEAEFSIGNSWGDIH